MSTAPTDYRQVYRAMTTPRLISEAWATQTDPKMRDQIMSLLVERERQVGTEGGGAAAWPSGPMAEREEMAGLYPDPADPQFAARLFAKREFYEARAVTAGIADGSVDPCTSAAVNQVFELTPVQRIVSRFLHPLTPYQGMLLFHGVGVGKTCSAVTIAEQFLEAAPTKKVIVLVPQALKENFKMTVFNPDRLKWNAEEKRWSAQQCTGVSYLERLGLLNEPDLQTVTYKVAEDRRARYTVTGYQAFANWIERTLTRSIPTGLTDPVARRAAEDEILRQLFSDHLVIIDEAHNLRDVEEEGGGRRKETVAKGEAAESDGGKALNPYLRRIVLHAEGLRLVLMTATPMYNSAPEIVLLLNYLLLNDTKNEKAAMKIKDMFTRDGDLIPGAPQRLLERVARRYVSYMRGENPYTFPLRMRPIDATENPADQWPETSATKNPVVLVEGEKQAINALPLIFTELVAGSPPEVLLRSSTSRAVQAAAPMPEGGEEGAPVTEAEAEDDSPAGVDAMLDARIQMANLTYPNMLYGSNGFNDYFQREFTSGGPNKLRIFRPKVRPEGVFNVDSVFAGEGLRAHAPKIHRIVESVKRAQGLCFVYSRYIMAGALPMAIALERAGFQRKMADGSVAPLLIGATPVAPVCAICGSRKGVDHAADHPFSPAYYVLLTSEPELAPRFPGLVAQAANVGEGPLGPLGTNVKVVIGSQVASEGLDLKCIREMHILDAWYHLNRIDQIIGRAIRYCSHSALRAIEVSRGLSPLALNNCLIYLHAAHVPDFETADLYAYRIAIGKALMVGRVQRLLKQHAWDCNLELEAIVFTGLPPRRQIDAQGNDRRTRTEAGGELEGYSINDVDFTTYCDYQECRHACAVAAPRSEAEGLRLNTSTFSVTDARRIILGKQSVIRRLFEDQIAIPDPVLQEIFSDLPWEIASEALMEILDGRRFRLRRRDGVEGVLVKKAGYVVFQPVMITDSDIPMTMRYARAFQLKRRFMDPSLPVFGRAEEVPAVPRVARATTEGPAAAAVPPPPPPSGTPAIVQRWTDWLTFVNSRGSAPLPPGLPSTLSLWKWLLTRYESIPEARIIALRWWFDKVPTYEEHRALLELALSGSLEPPIEALEATVRTDLFRSKQLVAYRVFNPDTGEIESYCRSMSVATFGPCDSKIATLVDRELNKATPAIPADMGTLFGFLAPKAGRVVFKTLDTTKPRKHSSVGAECGNTSNLGEHHPRIRILHEAGRASEMADLMLPDAADTWDEAGARARAGRPEHMRDLSHQPLCLYMEFLTRILDARRVVGKRWFLNAVQVVAAGLKGKK